MSRELGPERAGQGTGKLQWQVGLKKHAEETLHRGSQPRWGALVCAGWDTRRILGPTRGLEEKKLWTRGWRALPCAPCVTFYLASLRFIFLVSQGIERK